MGSLWESGYPWMTQDLHSMPILNYDQLYLKDKEEERVLEECYEEPFFLTQDIKETAEEVLFVQECFTVDSTDHHLSSPPSRSRSPLLVDMMIYGWSRSLRVIKLVLRFITNLKHKLKSHKHNEDCISCTWNGNIVEREKKYERKAEHYLYRQETKVIQEVLTGKRLERYKMKDGIIYSVGRIIEENPFKIKDMEIDLPFFDGLEITGITPVVLADSPVFHSYVIHVHLHVQPHSGVEITLREVQKKMTVPDGARRIIKRIRTDCVKCKMIILKTVELEMSKHTAARTILAPPFYNVMMDIAFGFTGQPYKNARKTFKVYAIVIVCLLTSATNILACEGLETQDVIQALERHSARYGVPAAIYVDQGTQLKAIKHAGFSTRSLETQLVEKLDIRVVVSNAKAHCEQGRVENKIKLIRETLEKTGIKTTVPQTTLQWETLFSKIASTLDDIPIAKGNSTNARDIGFEIITPNRIKLGRNNKRSLYGEGIDLEMSSNYTMLLDRNKQIYRVWYQMYIDSIHLISLRPAKWMKSGDQPKLGDVVLFVMKESPDYNKKTAEWRLGIVVEIGERKVTLEFSGRNDKSKRERLVRSPRDVCVLLSVDELAITSKSYFERLLTSIHPDGGIK